MDSCQTNWTKFLSEFLYNKHHKSVAFHMTRLSGLMSVSSARGLGLSLEQMTEKMGGHGDYV